MRSSGFVKAKEDRLPTGREGAKTVATVVIIGGRKCFKKQLAAGYRDDLRHRMAMYKEFETGQQLRCPYIIRYIGINEDEQGMYVLMEHVNGMNIAEKIKEEPEYFRNPHHTERMVRQLLEALQALHRQNIAYLDLKPENIMLTQISNDVRLTDLGGCFTDSNDYTAECTNGYAAPELADDRIDEVDARTDIYGVGKLLEYIEEKTEAKLPKRLALMKERCLNADKTKRYESVDEMIKVLDRRKRKIRIAVCSVALLVAAVVWWRWFATTEQYRRLALYVKSDAVIEGIYYAKASEDSATCRVIGMTDWATLYIREKIELDGTSCTITEIADSAFKGIVCVESVNLPKGLKLIGEQAFYGCERLVTVTLPEGFTTLEHACFKATGVRNVSFPKSLKSIGHASFAECQGLTSLVIPEGVETLEMDAFACCHNLVSVQLPSTLKTISRGVFWECPSLREIRIPASVTTIGEYAFFRCNSLKHVYNYSLEPQPLSVIFNRRDITLHVPAAAVEAYRRANHWNMLEIVGDL